MNGEQRREKIIDILNSSSKPVSGVALASMRREFGDTYWWYYRYQ